MKLPIMRPVKTFVFAFFLIIEFSIFGQISIPRGMVELSENKYIDKTEVCNKDYRLYIKWLKHHKGDSSKEYQKALPISDKKINIYYNSFDSIMDIDINTYMSHPMYDNHPVVSLTYDQAIQYCQWREQRINDVFYLKKNPEADIRYLPKNIPQIYKVRLPTKEEWLLAASKSNNTIDQIESEALTGNFNDSGVNYPVSFESNMVNSIGCINMYGNVAEMTNLKGVALGGSFMDNSENIRFNTEFKYVKEENWIGFRCIAEKLK